nr:ComEC/Rec2 family competence protein [Ancylobacter lacus]
MGAGAVLFGLLALLARAARERPALFFALAGLAAVAAGFGAATLRVAAMAHPVLDRPLTAVELSGFVEQTGRRPGGARIVLRVTALARAPVAPERVRLVLGGAAPPAVGSHLTLRATLGPPAGPAFPGGYDFGEDAWFEGIGATGFAVGRPRVTPPPAPPSLGLRLRIALDEVRQAMDARIAAALPGGTGAIASALVTGSRDAVPESVDETMRISGLYHVLSISGLHMALVVAALFLAARAGLAAVPGLALHRPIKAWAAVPAAAGATFYLLLSGAEVATQRSWLMAMVVLAGVALNRPAVTLRTLALAALAVLALSPAALVDPGTQMSFAATLALVAGHERFAGHIRRLGGPGGGGRALRWGVAVLLSSLVAALATAPFAAYHFHRMAPLSLIANLAAAPVISFVVMPAGMLGALLIPFGWDGPAWRAMGWGIDAMIAIAEWVAAMPGADRGMRAFPLAALVLVSLALVALCLLRSRLALLAVPLAAAAALVTRAAPQPAILIDTQGRTVAVRDAGGRLALMGDRDGPALASRFAVQQWRAAEGERPAATAATTSGAASALPPEATAPRCDPLGCTLPLPEGGLVAYSRSRNSLADDCRLARLVVTRFAPPPDCAARVIRTDPDGLAGAIAVYIAPTAHAAPAEAPPRLDAASAPEPGLIAAGAEEVVATGDVVTREVATGDLGGRDAATGDVGTGHPVTRDTATRGVGRGEAGQPAAPGDAAATGWRGAARAGRDAHASGSGEVPPAMAVPASPDSVLIDSAPGRSAPGNHFTGNSVAGRSASNRPLSSAPAFGASAASPLRDEATFTVVYARDPAQRRPWLPPPREPPTRVAQEDSPPEGVAQGRATPAGGAPEKARSGRSGASQPARASPHPSRPRPENGAPAARPPEPADDAAALGADQ